MRTSDNPLPEAIREVYGSNSLLADFVNYAGLAGLVASFFSIIYAYSRQLFALSRAGYLPKVLSLTSGRNTPWVALIVPGTIGFLLAATTKDGALLINIAVFGATTSYVLLNLSHIMLRRREPDLERAYRTPGGVVTTGVGLVLSMVAVVATFFVDIKAAGITAGVFAAALAYFWFYSRHHLVGERARGGVRPDQRGGVRAAVAGVTASALPVARRAGVRDRWRVARSAGSPRGPTTPCQRREGRVAPG